MKVMLDTNIFDRIMDSEELTRRVSKLVNNGQIEVLSTHIQEDELQNIPDMDKRKRIALIPRIVMPTKDFVWGISKWGMARWSEEDNAIESIRRGNLKHTKDAMIASTAEGYADVLVTEDKTLAKRVKNQRLSVVVWDYQKFHQYIGSL